MDAWADVTIREFIIHMIQGVPDFHQITVRRIVFLRGNSPDVRLSKFYYNNNFNCRYFLKLIILIFVTGKDAYFSLMDVLVHVCVSNL